MKNTFTLFSRFCLGVLFFACIGNVHAQNLKVGALNKASSYYDPIILGEDDDAIYVLASFALGSYKLEAYDKNNSNLRMYSVPVQHDKIGKNKVEVEKVSLLKDELLVFYSYFDKETKLYNLFAKPVNKKTGEFKDVRADIASIEVEKKRRKGDFTMALSDDRSKLFIYHVAYSKAYKMDMRKYMLLDNDLNILFEKELDEGEFMPRNYIVDNDGSIYYLKYSDMDLYVGSYDANRDYENWEEKIVFENSFGESHFLHNLQVNITKDNNMTVTGLVTVGEPGRKTKVKTNGIRFALESATNKGDLKGSVFISMDRESKELHTAKFNPFSEELFEQFRTNKDVKKGKKGDMGKSYAGERVINKDDGSVLMIVEQYSAMNYTDRHGNVNGRYVEFGDLVIMNFDNEGDMVWANRLPKRQYFFWQDMSGAFIASSRGLRFIFRPLEWKTTRHFSAATGLFDDKLVVLYNDMLKNVNERTMHDKQKRFKKPRKAVTVKYEFDLETGERKKSLYPDYLVSQTYLCPLDHYQQGKNSNLILYGIKGKKYSYSILSND
ncbi:hypothetical protein RCC89_01960 [Cytophagaceae bacterium ABcell3]|nr:hypothetical protein RCC89_01960 [Cytophagaceae bacterium ABcell3]